MRTKDQTPWNMIPSLKSSLVYSHAMRTVYSLSVSACLVRSSWWFLMKWTREATSAGLPQLMSSSPGLNLLPCRSESQRPHACGTKPAFRKLEEWRAERPCIPVTVKHSDPNYYELCRSNWRRPAIHCCWHLRLADGALQETAAVQIRSWHGVGEWFAAQSWWEREYAGASQRPGCQGRQRVLQFSRTIKSLGSSRGILTGRFRSRVVHGLNKTKDKRCS